MAVLSRVLMGVLGAAAVVGMPGVAAADPPPVPVPQPVLPNVNALAPVKLSEYAVMDSNWFVFTSSGVTCALQKGNGYGCNGPLPGAPDGSNLVSGSFGGIPAFYTTGDGVFASAGPAKPLPVGSRISYQTVSCGNDGTTTTCVDSAAQSGFVIGPTGSFILTETPPLLDRPEGTNPFMN